MTHPPGWPDNSDVGDLARAEGGDALALLLEAATEPPKPAPRYKLLGSADLAALPPLAWRVRGVLPAVGLAGLYGPSSSGKSFLALDMAAAIAEGQRWFDCRVESAPVVYAALEGEAGFKLRAQAWEAHKGRTLPAGLQMVLQPFKLTDPRDVNDLAAVVPAGSVVFLDTLNRAAPTADENSSKDMGEILEGAKRLQSLTAGLVVLIHHTGIGERVPELLAAMMNKALEGDVGAARLLLERAIAPLKGIEQAVTLQLPNDGTLTAKAAAVLSAAAAGELAPGQAAQLITALGTLAKISEVDELAGRIALLEQQHAKP